MEAKARRMEGKMNSRFSGSARYVYRSTCPYDTNWLLAGSQFNALQLASDSDIRASYGRLGAIYTFYYIMVCELNHTWYLKSTFPIYTKDTRVFAVIGDFLVWGLQAAL